MINNTIRDYLNNLMIPISGGVEHIRDYKDEQKWISTNSKMSIPGQRGNLTETVKEIIVKPFLIAKYPLTKKIYEVILDKESVDFETESIPIVNVSWFDAISFCNILSKQCGLNEYYTFGLNGESNVICNLEVDGYRLPTDAEWQYTCKAESTGYRYGDIDKIAWYSENSEGKIHEVGKKDPNKWGLYDMLGNTWEWCWDLYDENKYGPYRIFRGGSWAEQERGCGATCRRRGHPLFKIDDLGFRLARSMK